MAPGDASADSLVPGGPIHPFFRILNKRVDEVQISWFRLDLPSKYDGLRRGLARFKSVSRNTVGGFAQTFRRNAAVLDAVWRGLRQIIEP